MPVSRPPVYVPKLQPDAQLDQAAPVAGTWYTVLDTKRNCRLIGAWFSIAAVNENLDVRITIDGQVMTSGFACGAGQIIGVIWYHYLDFTNTIPIITVNDTHYVSYKSYFCEGKSVKVEVRKTTANGNGNLQGRVTYALW